MATFGKGHRDRAVDKHIVGPVLKKLQTFGDWKVLVVPDHPTRSASGPTRWTRAVRHRRQRRACLQCGRLPRSCRQLLGPEGRSRP